MAQVDTFHVVLRDVNRHEGLERREFDLALGKTFPIGRSSRNSSKPELMPAAHNAYINSPVISRDHAVLSVEADDGRPQVYLKDVGSMHGTQVNGTRLLINKPTLLSSGDTVQFGIDVNRNEEFYVARKYVIEFHLNRAPPSFSRGFTVPDSDGEEEVPASQRHGSQGHPLCIDDSDDSDVESVAPPNAQPVVHEVTVIKDLTVTVLEDESPTYFEEYPESAMRSTLNKAPTPEHQASSPAHSSVHDDLDACDHDLDSLDSAMDESDEMDIESELDNELDRFSEYSDDESIDAATDEAVVDKSSIKDVRAAGDIPLTDLSFPPSAQTFNPAYELPPFTSFRGSLTMDNVIPEEYLPPLPPRPTTSIAQLFGRDFDHANAAEMLRRDMSDALHQGDRSPWVYDQMPVGSEYDANYPTLQGSIYPHPDMSQLPNAYAGPSGFQTPPGLYSDAKFSTPPVPCRRTMMSIPDIVEEQPPTPTSVNAMKRKAEVLEDNEPFMVTKKDPLTVVHQEPLEVVETAPVANTSAEVQAVEPIVAVQSDVVMAQRPKKQPRSIMKKLRSTATIIGYGAVGAVGAFAVLANLPDTFFM